ncbi:uncharacterized protein LOC117641239 [Thrips palmi]|uniref:Uncharacterized protein LOC117641239 n=1 Tax=Thrips palmi TaxID=161013 RepID=A0A6P8YBU9_THRPL|nr:uncharacterized protein LOC117641239 [Thrips palmi]
MMSLVVPVALGLGLHAALTAQAMTAHHRSTDDDATKAEARLLAAAIETSLKNAFHPFYIESNFEPDEDFMTGLEGLELGGRVRRAAEPEGNAEGNPDDDAEEVTEEEAAGGEPPATGLRRWVIRIRNVMFGRRDLEGTEDGEAEGEPEPGRTWVESLANWFSHGIKSLLLRFSGGCPEEGGEAGEAPAMDGPSDDEETWKTAPSSSPSPVPSSTQGPSTPGPASPAGRSPRGRKARPSGRATSTTSTARSAPEPEAEPEATTPRPWTALPPLSTTPSDAADSDSIAPAPREATASAAPAGTVYDDEAFGGSHNAPPVETNELN